MSLLLLAANIRSAQGSDAIHPGKFHCGTKDVRCEDEPIYQARPITTAVLPDPGVSRGAAIRVALSGIEYALATKPATWNKASQQHLLNQTNDLILAATQLRELQAASVAGAETDIAEHSQAWVHARFSGAGQSVVDARANELTQAKFHIDLCPKQHHYIASMLAAQADAVLALANLTLAKSESLPECMAKMSDVLFTKHQVHIAEQEWLDHAKNTHGQMFGFWPEGESLSDFVDRVAKFDRDIPYDASMLSIEGYTERLVSDFLNGLKLVVLGMIAAVWFDQLYLNGRLGALTMPTNI